MDAPRGLVAQFEHGFLVREPQAQLLEFKYHVGEGGGSFDQRAIQIRA